MVDLKVWAQLISNMNSVGLGKGSYFDASRGRRSYLNLLLYHCAATRQVRFKNLKKIKSVCFGDFLNEFFNIPVIHWLCTLFCRHITLCTELIPGFQNFLFFVGSHSCSQTRKIMRTHIANAPNFIRSKRRAFLFL